MDIFKIVILIITFTISLNATAANICEMYFNSIALQFTIEEIQASPAYEELRLIPLAEISVLFRFNGRDRAVSALKKNSVHTLEDLIENVGRIRLFRDIGDKQYAGLGNTMKSFTDPVQQYRLLWYRAHRMANIRDLRGLERVNESISQIVAIIVKERGSATMRELESSFPRFWNAP